jgi:hypothetical protein
MKEIMFDDFQYDVKELLVRNKSIIDLITKYQDSNARVNRAVVKSVTQCGCIKINADKQIIPEDGNFEDIKKTMKTHVHGKLCENCRDMVEKEMGRNLFYLTSICNTLDLNLYDILLKEHNRIRMLGNYNLR